MNMIPLKRSFTGLPRYGFTPADGQPSPVVYLGRATGSPRETLTR